MIKCDEIITYTPCYTQCMTKMFRNKINKKIYRISHVYSSIGYLYSGEYCGINMIPIDCNEKWIVYKNQSYEECKFFVEKNFEKIGIL